MLRLFQKYEGDRYDMISLCAYQLGKQDSNLRMLESKSSALPLGDYPLKMIGYGTLTHRTTNQTLSAQTLSGGAFNLAHSSIKSCHVVFYSVFPDTFSFWSALQWFEHSFRPSPGSVPPSTLSSLRRRSH